MHRAQTDLLGEEMRQLSRQRHQVVTSLSDAARQLAHGVGKQASDATMRELEETLEAAIADAAARDALASGHLATAMRYSGLGAESRGVAHSAPPRRRPGGTAAGTPGRRSHDATQSAPARAEREAAAHARRRQKAMQDVDRCNRAIGEAEDRLRSLRSERSRAQAEVLKSERALKASERRVNDARTTRQPHGRRRAHAERPPPVGVPGRSGRDLPAAPPPTSCQTRGMTTLTHSDSIVIASSPENLYDLVCDITRMGAWSPVCKECWWDEGAGPAVGSWFTGRNVLPIGPGRRDRRSSSPTADASSPMSSTAPGPGGGTSSPRSTGGRS